MNTLLILACLAACLLIAINQVRLFNIVGEEVIPAVNQQDEDLERIEQQLVDLKYPSHERLVQ